MEKIDYSSWGKKPTKRIEELEEQNKEIKDEIERVIKILDQSILILNVIKRIGE